MKNNQALLGGRNAAMSIANNTKATRKSQIRICSAFNTLLKTIPYEKISISGLCQEADVSRQTFYKYFESLDSVAVYQLQQLTKKKAC